MVWAIAHTLLIRFYQAYISKHKNEENNYI